MNSGFRPFSAGQGRCVLPTQPTAAKQDDAKERISGGSTFWALAREPLTRRDESSFGVRRSRIRFGAFFRYSQQTKQADPRETPSLAYGYGHWIAEKKDHELHSSPTSNGPILAASKANSRINDCCHHLSVTAQRRSQWIESTTSCNSPFGSPPFHGVVKKSQENVSKQCAKKGDGWRAQVVRIHDLRWFRPHWKALGNEVRRRQIPSRSAKRVIRSIQWFDWHRDLELR